MKQIQFENVSYAWESRQGKRTALRGISGEFVSDIPNIICGTSGSGKTTLGLLCSGLVRPDSGELRYHPNRISTNSIAIVFQFPENLFLEDTVSEEFRSIHGSPADEVATEWLGKLGLNYSKIADRMTAKLSSAEGRLTAIALQLSRDPELLILDEPTIGLDSGHRKALMNCLQQWLSDDRILIVITHDLTLMKILGGVSFVLKEGQLRKKIETQELLSNKKQLEQLDMI